MAKTLPQDKTALFQFNLNVVDGVRRQKMMEEAFPVRLLPTVPFHYTDVTATLAVPLVIQNVTALLVLYSFSPMLLKITRGSETINNLPCSGLFTLSGAIDRVEIIPTPDVASISVGCAWA